MSRRLLAERDASVVLAYDSPSDGECSPSDRSCSRQRSRSESGSCRSQTPPGSRTSHRTPSASRSPVSVRAGLTPPRMASSSPLRTPQLRSRSHSSARDVACAHSSRKRSPSRSAAHGRRSKKAKAPAELPRIDTGAIPTLKGRDNPLPQDRPRSVLDRVLPDRKCHRPTLAIAEAAANRWLEIRADAATMDCEQVRARTLVDDPSQHFAAPELHSRYRKLLGKDRKDAEARLHEVHEDLMAATRAVTAYYGAALERATVYTARVDRGRSIRAKHSTVSFDVVKFTRDLDSAMQLLGSACQRLSFIRADSALGSMGSSVRGYMTASEALAAAPPGFLLPDDLTSQAKVEQEFKRRDALDKRSKGFGHSARRTKAARKGGGFSHQAGKRQAWQPRAPKKGKGNQARHQGAASSRGARRGDK